MLSEENIRDELNWINQCIDEEGNNEWNSGFKDALKLVLEIKEKKKK